jgi:hypothetical protein
MKNLSRVTQERLADIVKQSAGLIEVTYVNGVVNEVILNLASGPLFVRKESYSIEVCEYETAEKWKLLYQVEVGPDKVLVEKLFDSEYDRQQYIRQWCSTMPEDELTLEIVKVYK